MRSINNALIYSFIFIICAMYGCGYTTATVPRGGIKTIHIDIFKNSIDITKEVSSKDKYEVYRPDLEVDIRDAIVERIFLDGHLRVSRGEATDAVLEGEVVEYRKDPLRYQDENVTEYRISLVCNFALRRSGDPEVLLEETNLTGDSTYFTTGTLSKTEDEALKDATKDLARRIVNRIVENW
ncbi:MAG: LPS assembly lipoprotein LptE [Candidatus Omnitrophota bacterium]